MTNYSIRSISLVALAGAVASCSGNSATTPVDNSSVGGAASTGGTVTNGGNSAVGGALNTGGTMSDGGAGASGNVSTGGVIGTNPPATGGRTGSGGANPTGGSAATGGSTKITTGTGTGGSGAGGVATGGAAVGGNGGQKNTGGTTTASTGGSTAWQPSAACVQQASTLASQMTLAQRIGQMTMVDSGSLTTSLASQYFLGAVLTGGGTHPGGSANPDNSISGFANLISSYLNVGKNFSPHAGMLYGLDAVHGNGKVVNAVIFPHAIGVGATRNTTLAQQLGNITAQEMLGVGANWAYTPTLAATRDIRWGRTYETYSSEPDLTSQMGAAVIQGLQNSKLGSSQSVLACAKHFAGDGATVGGTNAGNCTLSDADFRSLAVEPYRASIDGGVGSIMVSYSSYQGTPMTDFKHWLTDVLKGELGFQGIVASDWDAVGRLTDQSGWNNQVTAAVNAGIDMIMLSGSTSTTDNTVHTAADLATALTNLVNSGAVASSRVLDAVTRILTVKCETGLLSGDTSVDTSLQSQIGSDAHRQVARQVVQQSLVLLKNDGLLPLSKSAAKILVTGSGADSLAKQCGGWTIGWQGLNDKGATATAGTTVLAAVKKKATGTVTTSSDGSGASGMTFAIVVVGEAPYAETQGDSTNPTLTAADFATISAVKSAGVPFVVVLFSGRPLILTNGGTSALDQSNAFIAAWLPGTEGDGIADVLFGDYKPTGKLSFEWPSSVSQLPLNVGDGQTPLFAYGYGLTYP